MSAAVKLSLTKEQAQALHWFLRHVGYGEAYNETPPHIGIEQRKERAYAIVHAAAEVEKQLAKAGAHGDAWMYSEEAGA